jgi:hypothetical protein
LAAKEAADLAAKQAAEEAAQAAAKQAADDAAKQAAADAAKQAADDAAKQAADDAAQQAAADAANAANGNANQAGGRHNHRANGGNGGGGNGGGGNGGGDNGVTGPVRVKTPIKQDATVYNGTTGAQIDGMGVIPAQYGDPRFALGSVGPTVGKDQGALLVIPDGKAFNGTDGRQQNDGDKAQNNYSVTDANFSNTLGVLATNPDTGQPMNYVEDIQTYGAAGYLDTFAPAVYAKLVAMQNAGQGTILGAAAYLMGLIKTPDPAIAGLTQADIASIPMTIPGSPIDARTMIASAKDITGQDWARPHHFEYSWNMYKGLVNAGVDWKDAMVLAGDDGVSGAGRVNGVNNQNGDDGFNDGERQIWTKGANIEAQTGIPVIQLMMAAHNMDSLAPGALTDPNINNKIGLPHDDRAITSDRANAIFQALQDGTISKPKDGTGDGTDATNDDILKGDTGVVAAISAVQSYQQPMNMEAMNIGLPGDTPLQGDPGAVGGAAGVPVADPNAIDPKLAATQAFEDPGAVGGAAGVPVADPNVLDPKAAATQAFQDPGALAGAIGAPVTDPTAGLLPSDPTAATQAFTDPGAPVLPTDLTAGATTATATQAFADPGVTAGGSGGVSDGLNQIMQMLQQLMQELPLLVGGGAGASSTPVGQAVVSASSPLALADPMAGCPMMGGGTAAAVGAQAVTAPPAASGGC